MKCSIQITLRELIFSEKKYLMNYSIGINSEIYQNCITNTFLMKDTAIIYVVLNYYLQIFNEDMQ